MQGDFDIIQSDLTILENCKERIGILLRPDGKLDQVGRRVNQVTKGSLQRLIENGDFKSLKTGHVFTLPVPVGMETKSLEIVILFI